MGEAVYKGKGVARQASNLLLKYAFNELQLNRVYLFTEVQNVAAQYLFERLGFVREGELQQDTLSHGKFVNRYVYGLLKNTWKTEHE